MEVREVKSGSNLGHLLAVSLGVEGSLSEEDRVLLGCHTQLVVKGVMPDLLHVVPVSDDTALDGRFAPGEDTSLCLSFISHVAVL